MRRRRMAGAVVASAGALVLGVIEPAVGASASHHAVPRIEAGTAAASANVLGVTPAVSGLALTTTIGEASAAYQSSETQAKSATVDLGSLGLVLATSTFCGQSLFPTSAQPKPLIADSQHGAAHLRKGGVGTEEVAVDTDPQTATAKTTTIEQNLPGILSVRGFSRAEVRYVDGREQVATSEVVEDVSLLGGKVRLDGMHWKVIRTSGVTVSRKTVFSFGRVTLAGKPMSAPDSATAATIAAINKVLAPVGLSVLAPVRGSNAKTGSISIGPFILRFSGSTLDRKLLGPAVHEVIELENLIRQAGQQGDDCTHIRQLIQNLGNSSETLVNVLLEISEGAGALDVQLGGVAAAAQDPVNYDNPFGDGVVPPLPPIGGGKPGSPIGAAASRTPAAATSGGEPVGAPPTLAAADSHCVSSSPSRAHGCWRGLATVASSAALAVGGLLLVGDLVLSRRRRRTEEADA